MKKTIKNVSGIYFCVFVWKNRLHHEVETTVIRTIMVVAHPTYDDWSTSTVTAEKSSGPGGLMVRASFAHHRFDFFFFFFRHVLTSLLIR